MRISGAAHRRMQAIRNRLNDLVSRGRGLCDPAVLSLSRALDRVVLEVMDASQGEGGVGIPAGGAARPGRTGDATQQG